MAVMAVPEPLMMLVVMAAAAATLITAANGVSGTFPRSVMTLERAFPANQKVELEELRARDRLRHARLLQNFAGGIANFPVIGSSDPYLVGLYFTRIKLGSPPREFNVQIDTGSDILWVTCSSCNNCPRTSGLGIELSFYDAASSSTAAHISCSDQICDSIIRTASAQCSTESNQCSYSFQYGDASGTSGQYVSDMLYFDTVLGASLIANSSAPIVFGCSTSQSGSLTSPDRAIDGIFGFGQHDLSVISQLSSRGITPKVFSHCLKGEGSGGGILVLGEILDARIVYTPLVPSQLHYNVYLQSIAVNGQLLPIDPEVFATSGNCGTIVDSGTTLAYLVPEAFEPFVSSITAFVSQLARPVISTGRQCFLVSTSITEIFPSVALNFAGGASMALRPSEYLVHMGFVEGSSLWCIGFEKMDCVTILGDIILKDKIFVYDLAHQRIGWADYDCSMSVNVSITSGKDEFISSGQLSVSGSSSSVFLHLQPTPSKISTHLLRTLILMIGFGFSFL
ncbi:PREDICTED: aspartic proteinase-like protein 2 [Ipomoea nil]|uniref:aspartic proteinase-like protein 2 n=1 Tax=Ipomoea nil TaxID=35883 RepID=UPI000901D57A|nr:PREDICTED: aspartic proteinase-like protein 2 [Ipomoea nil]